MRRDAVTTTPTSQPRFIKPQNAHSYKGMRITLANPSWGNDEARPGPARDPLKIHKRIRSAEADTQETARPETHKSEGVLDTFILCTKLQLFLRSSQQL